MAAAHPLPMGHDGPISDPPTKASATFEASPAEGFDGRGPAGHFEPTRPETRPDDNDPDSEMPTKGRVSDPT